MLKIYNSNRLENLFLGQCDLWRQPLDNPLMPEVVLVQSQGMARWLALQRASTHGISANFDYSFPAAFIWRLSKILDGNDAASPFDSASLRWAVLGQIEVLLEEPEFADLKKYLATDCQPLRSYQLAKKIAELLDQYMIFRPDWILQWASGEENHWQAILWRALVAQYDQGHRVTLLAALLEKIDSSFIRKAKLPSRISIFGVSALPPSLFMVFAKLAEFIDVHFFSLNPCREYWSDLISPAELTKISLNAMQQLDLVEDLHYEAGNSLLLNLGKMGRDFQKVLQCYDYEQFDFFEGSNPVSALATVQGSILNGTEPSKGAINHMLAEEDDSVQIHAVHSPMREVEVLFGNLLALFNKNSELNAEDVVVMVPDISLYSPLIEAVFSTPEHEQQYIPYTIADRGPGLTQELIQAFLELLALAGSRMQASAVLDLLAREPVRLRFGIQENELESIKGWVREAAILWGMDEDHRQQLGVPKEKTCTWQAGLDSLILGYAMPDASSFFLDIFPCDLIEGSSAKLLEKFLDFYKNLERFIAGTRREMTLDAWAKALNEFLDAFLVDSVGRVNNKSISVNYEREKQTVRSAISDLIRQSVPAGFEQKISFDVVKTALKEELQSPVGYSDFLSGKLTFCQMVPMRSIPFKVIAILGMNDGAFPRQDRSVGFDLMTDGFRVGDRCRRDDDRYLFLESIISAREILYLSYVGIGARDNETFPPSVVVSELLEHLGLHFGLDEQQSARRFTVFHPLQPFSTRYFREENNLSSFSSQNRMVAKELQKSKPFPGFFSKNIKTEEKLTVSIDEFVAFFEHPVRYLMRNRLGIYLYDRYEEMQDRECFSLNSLERYTLLERLLSLKLSKEVADSSFLSEMYQDKALLPGGAIGRYTFNDIEDEVDSFIKPMLEQMGGERLDPVPVHLDLGRVTVVGYLANLWPNGQYFVRPVKIDKLNYRDSVRFWLFHLLLAAVSDSSECQTCFVGKDGQKRYHGGFDAAQELGELAKLFVAGMQAPLPLLPRASMEFAKINWQAAQGKEEKDILQRGLIAANKIWQEGDFLRGPEKTEPYMWTAFGDMNPIHGRSESQENFVHVTEVLLKKALQLRQ